MMKTVNDKRRSVFSLPLSANLTKARANVFDLMPKTYNRNVFFLFRQHLAIISLLLIAKQECCYKTKDKRGFEQEPMGPSEVRKMCRMAGIDGSVRLYCMRMVTSSCLNVKKRQTCIHWLSFNLTVSDWLLSALVVSSSALSPSSSSSTSLSLFLSLFLCWRTSNSVSLNLSR